MTKISRLAPLALLLSILDAHGACETRVEPMAFTDVKAGSGPAIRQSELRSVVMDPPAGAELREDTVLAIVFEYRIVDFVPGMFRVSPLYKTGLNRSRSFDPEGRVAEVELERPAGRVHLCLPMNILYQKHALEVTWPLELTLTILQGERSGSSRSVASSEVLKLNAVNVPAAALEKQAKAPPAEVEAALDAAFYNYTGRAAIYKVCLQRLPAMQATLTPAYRAWEARNRADIDWISTLKFDALKEQSQGNAAAAMHFIDHVGEFMQKSYEDWTEEQLRPQCADIIEQARDGDQDKALSRHLDVLRKWQVRP
jgi:hypothetical protein